MTGEIFGNFFKEFSQAFNPQTPETEIEVRSYKRDETFAKEIRPIIVDLEQVIRALSDLETFYSSKHRTNTAPITPNEARKLLISLRKLEANTEVVSNLLQIVKKEDLPKFRKFLLDQIERSNFKKPGKPALN